MDLYSRLGCEVVENRNSYRSEFSYYANCNEPSGFPFFGDNEEMRARKASCYIEMDKLLESIGSSNDNG